MEEFNISLRDLEEIVLSHRGIGRVQWKFPYIWGDSIEVEIYLDSKERNMVRFKRKSGYLRKTYTNG